MKLRGIKGNKNLKIIAATSMAIFSLMATFSASFAWFLANRTKVDESDDFSIDVIPGRFQEVTFHTLASKNVTEEEDDITFSFNQTEVGKITYNWKTASCVPSGNTSIVLDTYEMLDQRQPLLLLFKMANEIDTSIESPVEINANVDSDLTTHYLGERDEEDSTPVCALGDSEFIIETKDGKDYYGMSSVIQFYIEDYSSAAYTSWKNGKTTYDFRLGDMSKPETGFVEVSNTEDTSSFNPDIQIYNSGKDALVEYVAVIVDYFPDSIEYIYSTFLGNEKIEEYDYVLYFKCDWGMEVI